VNHVQPMLGTHPQPSQMDRTAPRGVRSGVLRLRPDLHRLRGRVPGRGAGADAGPLHPAIMARNVAVTRLCGCDDIIEVYGTEEKRRHLQSFATETRCWRHGRDHRRQSEYAAARDWAEREGLPRLTDTERQIIWAESVRRAIQEGLLKSEATYDAGMVRARSRGDDDLVQRHVIALHVVGELLQATRIETSASWFLDSRPGLEFDRWVSAAVRSALDCKRQRATSE
jgi:hypothetical protein